MADRADFETSFSLLIGHEGGYTNIASDRGNWTSGVIGVGRLLGTKFGIAAHAYPHLDIPNLTLADAHDIYTVDYWNKAGCHDMPPRLAFVTFDCAVNNGVGRAVRFLQTITGGVNVDGVYGPRTKAALERHLRGDPTGTATANELHGRRIFFMAGISTWRTFGLGWSRRLAKVPMEAASNWPIKDVVA